MTDHPWIIRLGEDRDAGPLAEFNLAMAFETEGKQLDAPVVEAGVKGLLNNPAAGFYVVAQHETEVRGALMVTFEWSDWRNKFFWWIQSVYVTPSHRRQGAFTRLLRAVMEMAAERDDVCGLRLYVEQNNHIAQSTYKSLGLDETHYDMYEVMFSTKK